MREVYAIQFKVKEFVEVYWSVQYIDSSSMADLKQEWDAFFSGIPHVWYYGVQSCDEIRMGYLLEHGESYELEWIDAQTKIAHRIMNTDANGKFMIEDSFVYPGDVSVIGDFLLENPNGLKVINDVENLLNLILTAQFIVL